MCRETKSKALKDMEYQLNIPAAEIKAKILKLRSQLGREISKISKTKLGQGTSELYKPCWIYYDRLQFLLPVMQPGRSRDNLQGTLC